MTTRAKTPQNATDRPGASPCLTGESAPSHAARVDPREYVTPTTSAEANKRIADLSIEIRTLTRDIASRDHEMHLGRRHPEDHAIWRGRAIGARNARLEERRRITAWVLDESTRRHAERVLRRDVEAELALAKFSKVQLVLAERNAERNASEVGPMKALWELNARVVEALSELTSSGLDLTPLARQLLGNARDAVPRDYLSSRLLEVERARAAADAEADALPALRIESARYRVAREGRVYDLTVDASGERPVESGTRRPLERAPEGEELSCLMRLTLKTQREVNRAMGYFARRRHQKEKTP